MMTKAPQSQGADREQVWGWAAPSRAVQKPGGYSDSRAHPLSAPPLPPTHGTVTAHPAGDRHCRHGGGRTLPLGDLGPVGV